MDWTIGDLTIIAAILAGVIALVLYGTGHIL